MVTGKVFPSEDELSRTDSYESLVTTDSEHSLSGEAGEGGDVDLMVSSPSINTKLDDQALQHLIGLIIQQDQSAFTRLYKVLASRVYSLALRITRNKQLAEEVMEDTFYQIWRQAPRFNPLRGTVTTWVLTIARSRALDGLRAVPPLQLQDEQDLEYQIDHEASNNSQDLLRATENNQRLHLALAKLEAVPRQLVALSFFRGMTHEEIARHTDLPLGTVKSHLRRAIIQLRETLAIVI